MSNTDKQVIPIITDPGMRDVGFCECDQHLTTQCDPTRNPHCCYAAARVDRPRTPTE